MCTAGKLESRYESKYAVEAINCALQQDPTMNATNEIVRTTNPIIRPRISEDSIKIC